MRTKVFVDGYNLYYGLLRGTRLKWLDLVALFERYVLHPSPNLLEVRYYTAPVLAKMCDSAESARRQRIYLQALRTLYPMRLQIVEGRMAATKPFLRLVSPINETPEIDRVQVYDFTEKKTDVNLACDMLNGALKGEFEQVVVCSNDSDLEAAFASIRKYHPQIRLGLVAPIARAEARYIASDLKQYAHWSKILSKSHIAQSQLPERIPGLGIRRPDAWA